jgi:hypothetical protein
MRVFSHVLRAVAWRFVRVFTLLLGLWALVAELQLMRRQPMLLTTDLIAVLPNLVASAAVPCALAAYCAAISGSFAEFGRRGELVAAAASGHAPRRLVAPALALGLALVPWLWHGVGELDPAARVSRHQQVKALLRSPVACLGLIQDDEQFGDAVALSQVLQQDGEVDRFWAVELAQGGLAERVWRGTAGRLDIPAGLAVLRLALDDVELWTLDPATPRRVAASQLTLRWPIPELMDRAPRVGASRFRELDRDALNAEIETMRPGAWRQRALAERAGRWALTIAPVPLCLAAVVLGLALARRGAWAGTLGGVGLFGLLYMPLHLAFQEHAAAALSTWAMAAPGLLVGACAVYPLRRWRLT